MNKLYLIALFCLLAAIGTEGFAQRGKTSPRRPAEAISQTSTQEEDADSSDVKGGISPADESGSLGNPSEEAEPAGEESQPKPEPYSFSYEANTDDGASSTREESQDKSGKITGFYTLTGPDGQNRRVNYVADKTGFHATITTNEVGTESKNPADVTIDSSAPEVVYPAEGSSSGSSSGSSRGSSNTVSTGSVKSDVVDDSGSSDENDDFGSASSASSGNNSNAKRPSAPAAARPAQESQQEDNSPSEEAEAEAAPQQPTKSAPRPQQPARLAPRPAPRPAQPTKTAPRPQQPARQPAPVQRQPARQAPQATKSAPRPQQPARLAPRPAPRPAQPTKTAPRPQPAQPTKSGQKSQAVAPRPAPAVQRRPAPRPQPAPVKTSQETNVDDEEDSFGGENNEQSADSTNSQYMVFPLNGVNRPEIANLISNRRPIVAANRNSGLWLNENQLRNLLAVSRYRS